jgi:hypothetical protein
VRARVAARLKGFLCDRYLKRSRPTDKKGLRLLLKFLGNLVGQAPGAQGPGNPVPLLDALIHDLCSKTHWIESTHTKGIFEALAAAKSPELFCLMSETLRKQATVEWAKVFPNCPKGGKSPSGDFIGMQHETAELKDRIDGRAEAADWYLDWRVAKDRYMYDFFELSLPELPNFCSITGWPDAPMPFTTYGMHMFVWKSELLDRAVWSVSDRGVPRRSMLLTLQDLLCKTMTKEGRNFLPEGERFTTLELLLRHLQAHRGKNRVCDQTRLAKEQHALLDKEGYLTTPGKSVQALDGGNVFRANLEVHVFGEMRPYRDALGIFFGLYYQYEVDKEVKISESELFDRLNELKKAKAPWLLAGYRCMGTAQVVPYYLGEDILSKIETLPRILNRETADDPPY